MKNIVSLLTLLCMFSFFSLKATGDWFLMGYSDTHSTKIKENNDKEEEDLIIQVIIDEQGEKTLIYHKPLPTTDNLYFL